MENKSLKKYNRVNVFDKNSSLLPIEQRTFTTNNNLGGYQVTLIDASEKRGYVTAKIEDYVFEARMEHIRSGQVKYPFHPSVYGVGHIGIHNGPKAATSTQAYKTWVKMLKRSYSKKYHVENPSYKDVTVHSDWHNFQNFQAWFDTSNYHPKWDLDKDLLYKGAKIYSKDTCIFLPHDLNTFLANVSLNNTSGFTGVTLDRKTNRWRATIMTKGSKRNTHLGMTNTKEEAYALYQKARAIQVIVYQEAYKDTFSMEVLNKIR